jgi:ADP-ribose pyrophosphatase YjhB (NUDIX family)
MTSLQLGGTRGPIVRTCHSVLCRRTRIRVGRRFTFAYNDGRPKRRVVVRPAGAQTGILLTRADGDEQSELVGQQFGGRVGWADIGYSPFEVAAKEANEETGLIVKPVRLLALFDKRKHPHPPQPWYVYKAFIECEVQGGSLIQETPEAGGARWFREDELGQLELSTDRTTASQLAAMFRFAVDPHLPALCD